MITYPLNNVLYNAEDAELFHCTRSSGVFAGDDFGASVSGANNNISIQEGIAWIRNSKFSGKVAALKSPIVLDLGIADPSYPRIDAVVIQFDANKNSTEIIVKNGTPASAPTPPAVVRSEALYELHLYHVRRDAGASVVPVSSITDLRSNPDYCGLMADDVSDLSNIYLSISSKGVANGVASLDESGKIPESQIPEITMSFEDLTEEQKEQLRGVGVSAVVYDGPPNPREIYVDYYATNLSQGVSYKVTVDVMGRLELLSGGATGKVSISLVPRNADNAMVGSPVQGASVLPSVSEWKTLEWTVTIPSGVTKPVFRVGFYDAIGTVYVDNLTITRMTSPSGAVSLIDPSFEAGLVPSQKTGGWTFDDWNINFVSLSNDAASNGSKSAKLQYGLTTQWKTIYTDGTEQPITAPAFPDVSGYMPIHGGAFTGAVYSKDLIENTAQLRNTGLVSTETYPTKNGQINWQYE